MSDRQTARVNWEALNRFWQRTNFHDMAIEQISALNRRVNIRLKEFTLVVTKTTELQRCELPAVWLVDSVTDTPAGFRLSVETDRGQLIVSGVDVRLLRNCDLAVLIPPIDC